MDWAPDGKKEANTVGKNQFEYYDESYHYFVLASSACQILGDREVSSVFTFAWTAMGKKKTH